MNNLMILRRVQNLSPQTLKELSVREGDMPYFPDWIDNDLPRDGAYTDEIMQEDNTLGFGIADESGTVLKKFKTLEEAERAKRGAKVTFEVKVDVDGEQGQD